MIDMTDWDVTEKDGVWIGRIGLPQTPSGQHIPPELKEHRPQRFVAIMPSSFPWELAVDALLDFMDRLRTFRVPVGIDTPRALMNLCVAAARKRR
jgi:hypothetical protein